MANPGINASTAVADNLADAAHETGMNAVPIKEGDGVHGTVASTEEHAPSPTALGFDSTGWVAIAALVVVAIMLWKKVPTLIGGMLDTRIAAIRTQLDEAAKLRAEAEALRAEYEAKAKSAHADAETMREHARAEAHGIIVKAKADAEALMDRRAKMAEDKIAAAERAAIAEVRARAADAAAKAAGLLIAEHHNATADHAMVSRTIAGLGRPN
ncbi:ATP synthase subunit B [Sphingomonas sp. Leaf339]|uniref:F0F1 ATP synthase subunit B family protein n=1 Tax=Sphingomonas sp. Leaf339 TaxID=1736343 RepID=UPI0006F73DC5|nr:ATP synthase subunit B [Sphingomonas sp. Leaf339]KQU62179.1 ATP synthase subunit B [Sphingomonas sp. Leaf339]